MDQRKPKHAYRYLLIALGGVLGIFFLYLVVGIGIFLGFWGDPGPEFGR